MDRREEESSPDQERDRPPGVGAAGISSMETAFPSNQEALETRASCKRAV